MPKIWERLSPPPKKANPVIHQLWAEKARRGESLRAFADRVGVSHSALYRWFCGERTPTLGVLVGVCDRLGWRLTAVPKDDTP